MGTLPDTHVTMRTTWGWDSRMGMQSTRRTTPSSVSNSVSSTSVSPR